ncbi:hypothetical protein IGI04_033215 [Brassica rapa subsp. trilocularis]|uniref:Uncharacterized protein n=1 Tax=Brassica rapa subsp. trilocularis TaxID=1813537 RepID=A0ABQ7L811_BRACM|nr:hypothetical protein IGI04_033215 [Brassica rapa subsp. trilocularis]
MKKATALMKRIVVLLSSVKNKTSAFKTRLMVLSLVKHKNVGFRSISNKIHNLLGHSDDQDHDQDRDESKAIILYSSGASTVAHHDSYDVLEEESDKYPDLRHTLFEGDEDFGELEEGSVIDMVKNSKEEEGESFKLEDEIDHVADLFISRFHKQMKLQKLLSFKRIKHYDLFNRGQLFLLKLTGDGEHRLNPTLLDSITSAITQIRSDPSSSQSVLITTSDGKFFSNGYDLALADSDPSLRPVMDSKLRSLVADLISLPMPTIAAVTGHASAAGFVLAMSHDYVLMRGDRGFLYMSELDIELVIPPWFAAMIRMKIGSPAARRDVMLKAEKVTAERGLEMGIVDSSYGSAAETVEGAVKLGEELFCTGFGGIGGILYFFFDVERLFYYSIGRILHYQLDMNAFDEDLDVYDDESD